MVDNQDPAALHAPFCRLPEAVLVVIAFLAQAIAGLGADAVPYRSLRRNRQVGEGAVGRLLRPVFNLLERIKLAVVLEQRVHTRPRLLQPALAEVVAAAFDQHGDKLIGIDRLQQGNVLVDKLFLQ